MANKNFGRYVMPVLFATALILSIIVIRPFIVALLTSAVIAYIAYPLFKLINRWIKNRTVASLTVSFVILLIITIPVTLVIETLSRESYLIYIQGKQMVFTGNVFSGCKLSLCTAAKNLLAEEQVRFYIQKAMGTAATYFIENASDFVVSIPRRALELFIIVFASFYLIRDGDKITAALERYLVAGKQKQHILGRFSEVMYAVVFGAISVAFIQAVLGTIGFALFGVSSPITWGVLMFFLALIPYGGTALIWVPASALMMLQEGFWKGAGLFIYSFIFVGLIDNLLKPKIIGDRSRVHPVIVLVGIFGGIALMGLPGIVVGPVILAMTMTFLELYVAQTKNYTPEG